MADKLIDNVFVTDDPSNISPIVSNVFVTPSTSGTAQTGSDCRSMIGFRNSLITSAAVGTDADPVYPFINCLDYRDNTQYSPNLESGSMKIEFRHDEPIDLDYIGIAIHNGYEAELTGQLECLVAGQWVVVATFSPIGTNRTICEYFDTVESVRERLTLTFTSKLYLGALYIGKSWAFSRMPNVGFTPANWNNVDEVIGFDSNSNQFVIGRVQERGYEQTGAFDLLKSSDIDAEYTQFMKHVKAGNKPFFMKWNVATKNSIFGQHTRPNQMQAPSYTTSFTATFNFSLRGYN